MKKFNYFHNAHCLRQPFQRLKRNNGVTLIEIMISAVVSAIILLAVFSFYSSLSHQAEVQVDVSEVQNVCRNSIFEIRKTLHKAGNRLGSHKPYEIKGDSLAVYFSETQAVDTVLYFLQEFTEAEYTGLPNLPNGRKIYKLMKQTNNLAATIFSDFITSVNFIEINATSMAVTIVAQSSRQDDTYSPDNGYRSYSLGERVNLRYLKLLLGT